MDIGSFSDGPLRRTTAIYRQPIIDNATVVVKEELWKKNMEFSRQSSFKRRVLVDDIKRPREPERETTSGLESFITPLIPPVLFPLRRDVTQTDRTSCESQPSCQTQVRFGLVAEQTRRRTKRPRNVSTVDSLFPPPPLLWSPVHH